MSGCGGRQCCRELAPADRCGVRPAQPAVVAPAPAECSRCHSRSTESWPVGGWYWFDPMTPVRYLPYRDARGCHPCGRGVTINAPRAGSPRYWIKPAAPVRSRWHRVAVVPSCRRSTTTASTSLPGSTKPRPRPGSAPAWRHGPCGTPRPGQTESVRRLEHHRAQLSRAAGRMPSGLALDVDYAIIEPRVVGGGRADRARQGWAGTAAGLPPRLSGGRRAVGSHPRSGPFHDGDQPTDHEQPAGHRAGRPPARRGHADGVPEHRPGRPDYREPP